MPKDSGLRRGAPQPWERSNGGRRVVAESSGTTGGQVPNHYHDASAIISGELADDRLPSRLSEYAPHVDDLNTALSTGSWTADGSTANMPDDSFFVGHTIADSTLDQGFFAQVAYEITDDQRMFRRVCLFGAWQAWIEV